MKTVHYNGFKIEFFSPTLYQYGRKARTAIIYKDDKAVGGSFAITGVENLASKVRAKIKRLKP